MTNKSGGIPRMYNALDPCRLSPAERLDEIADILAIDGLIFPRRSPRDFRRDRHVRAYVRNFW
jgi:hypothetical protein